MKKLIVIFICSLVFMGCMSLSPLPDGRQRIFDFDMDKDALFIATNEWLTETINNAKFSIEFSDINAGKVIGDVIVYLASDPARSLVDYRAKINYNFTIKNKKVRLIMKSTGTYLENLNYRHLSQEYDGILNNGWVSAEKQEKLILTNINNLFQLYKKYVETYNNDF